MTHDPMCILFPRIDGRSRGFCVCDVIKQARDEALSGEVALASESYDRGQRDMLAKCIAAVERLPSQVDYLVMRSHAVTALLSLLEGKSE
jgi:hypothetical protein